MAATRDPPLRTGSPGRFDVLGRTTAYPVGSVTHFAASSLPVAGGSGLFLIHAPRAFYAIPDTFQAPDSHTTCTLTYDPSSKQFTMPGDGMQWNLVGVPEPASNLADASDWSLGLHIATVAQDGHVLYNAVLRRAAPDTAQGQPLGLSVRRAATSPAASGSRRSLVRSRWIGVTAMRPAAIA